MRLLLLLLILFSITMASINYEVGAENFKIVNGDSLLEIKGTCSMRLTEFDIDFFGAYIGLGISEQYTAPRSSIYSFNHYGDRFDWSLGMFLSGAEVIYTHSIRRKYDGASPDIYFFNNDIDSIKVRWKGVI